MNIQSLKKVVVSILTDLHSGFSTTNSLLTHIYVNFFCLINNLKVIMGVDIPRICKRDYNEGIAEYIYIEYDHPTLGGCHVSSSTPH